MANLTRLFIAFFAIVFCVAVMLLEDVGEFLDITWIEEWDELHLLEILILSFLFLAVIALGIELFRIRKQQQKLEDKVSLASKAFSDLLEVRFETWQFSDAERSVTKLLLKGCSIAEIAEIRQSKEGTVKAQTNSIYKKSGYANKTQLLSAFIEDLTDGGSVF